MNQVIPMDGVASPSVRVPQVFTFRVRIAMGLYQSLEHDSYQQVGSA